MFLVWVSLALGDVCGTAYPLRSSVVCESASCISGPSQALRPFVKLICDSQRVCGWYCWQWGLFVLLTRLQCHC